MIYTCCEENRRTAVDAHLTLNGIDWLEVLDLDAPPREPASTHPDNPLTEAGTGRPDY